MPEQALSIWRDFQERVPAPAREEIARHLLAEALVEVVCAECGRYALTVTRAQKAVVFECPGCHRRTFAVQESGLFAVFSETRLARLMAHAAAKTWFCPDHPGTAVRIVRMENDGSDPRRVALHYICRRGRFLARRRVHAGVIAVNLGALEVEQLATAETPGRTSQGGHP